MNEPIENKFLYQHKSPETAYVVDDYPWGFRLRTKIRYWIESKKGYGQRFASQTVNPKTGCWCAPKYSTYYPIILMYLDEKNHVKSWCLSKYSEEEFYKKFQDKHLSYLDDFQKDQLCELLAYAHVMNHVEVTIEPSKYGPVNLFSTKPEDIEKRDAILAEQEDRKKEKEKELEKINRAINHHYHKNKDMLK